MSLKGVKRDMNNIAVPRREVWVSLEWRRSRVQNRYQ